MTSYTIYIPGEVDLQEILQSPLIWKEFQQRWAVGSPRLSDLLFGVDTMNKMIDISVDFELTDEQTANVSRAVRDIALGYVYIGDLAAVLQKQLGIEQKIASEIGGSALEILRPCMDEIKKIQLARFRNRIEQAATKPIDQPKQENTSNIINLRKP
ncbi:MAG: hypothetical protein AAB483_01775 [Patescibacteria group bacterium]